MNFTLYCYGDLHLFAGGLRAVAMLFDPFTGGIVGESGLQIGSLTALALLVSLGGIAITGISRQRVNVDQLLVLLLVFGVLFIPKADLNVEDVVSGKVDIVQDVPLGVAAVGGVVSHISLVLAENFEAVFAIPAGAPAPWESPWPGMGFKTGEGGMNSPLRMLLATRAILVGDADNYLSTDLAYFVRECTRPPFDWADYHASPAKIDYLIEHSSDGITVYFDPALGDFRAMDCDAAKVALEPRLDEFFKDDNAGKFSQLVCANMETPPDYSGTTIACGDGAVADAYGRLLPELSTSGVTAAAFMKDLMLNRVVQATIGCGAPVNEDSFRLCLTTMTDALEQSRVQNAAAASGFQKIMIPAMNMFLFLFYAMSPLIAVVIAGSGMAGLSIAGKYMLFGVWSHSWLPVAVVIDYFMEASVKQELHNYALAYLNGNFDGARFYDIIADHISVASDLLAATPLVTLAIITGSMFSMTSLANRMGARDHVDETKLAPSTLKQDALTSNSYDRQSYGGVGTQAVTQRGGQVAFLSDQAKEQSHKLDSSMVRSAAQALGQTQSANFQRAAEASMQRGYEEMGQVLRRQGDNTSSGTENSAAYQTLKNVGLDFNKTYGNNVQLSDQAAAVLGAAVSVKGDGSLGGSFGFKGGGSKAAIKAAMSLGAAAGLSAEDQNKLTSTLQSAYSADEKNGFKVSGGNNAQYNEMVKDGRSAVAELSASAAKSFKEGASYSDRASTARAETAEWARRVSEEGRLGNSQSMSVAAMMQNAMLTDGGLAGRMVNQIPDMVAGMVSRANAAGADGGALQTAFNNQVATQEAFLSKNGQFQDPQQRKALAMMEGLAALAGGAVGDKNKEHEFAQAALGQALQAYAPQFGLGAGSGNAGLGAQVQERLSAAEDRVPGGNFGAEQRRNVDAQGEQAREMRAPGGDPTAAARAFAPDVVGSGDANLGGPTPGMARTAWPGMQARMDGPGGAAATLAATNDTSPGAVAARAAIQEGREFMRTNAGDFIENAAEILGGMENAWGALKNMGRGLFHSDEGERAHAKGTGETLFDKSPRINQTLPAEARDYFAQSFGQHLLEASGSGATFSPAAMEAAGAGLAPEVRHQADALAAQSAALVTDPSQAEQLQRMHNILGRPGVESPAPPPPEPETGSGADPTAEKKTVNGISLGPTSARYEQNIQHWNEAITTAKGEDYANLVADEAARQGVDPYLAVAVAAAESSFNPNAGSNKGAQGLMQLTAGTAGDLGLAPEERTDPAKNAQAGVRYLAQQLERFDGDVTLALAAYNAGPTAVARHDNQVPPYPETQAYVARVTDITHYLHDHAHRQPS